MLEDEHELFERQGANLYASVPISFAQAALGAEIKVPTLEEEEELKIPAGTQTGTEFRLRGKGVPRLRGYGQGDQRVKVRVVTPTRLSEKQKEVLREFGRLSGRGVHRLNAG